MHDTVSRVTCVACHGHDLMSFVSTRQVSLYRCSSCSSLTALPRRSQASLATYHNDSAYFDHPYFERRRRDVERVDARCRDLFERLRLVHPNLSLVGKRHLDVGCDTGMLVERMARLYQTTGYGIDVNARAVALARARGISAEHTDLAHAPQLSGFDLITLVDVIEHVADPIELLRDVRNRLRADGLCYVETPNITSVIYAIGGWLSHLTDGRPTWICERLFLPEHVQYLSARGLETAAHAAGFQTVALTRRTLSASDINTTPVVNAGLVALQAVDRLLQRQILHCAVLAL